MSSETRRVRVREEPRISAPKLGEYLDVRSANRRERIIHDQKFPADYIVARYQDAQNAIRVALLSDDVERRLTEQEKAIAGRFAANKYRADSRRCCIEAVAAFRLVCSILPLDGVARTLTGRSDLTVLVETVKVSANPIVLLERTHRSGRVERGAVQVVFRKESPLESHGGQAAAEILRRALIENGVTDVTGKLCIVVDAFAERYFTAPLRQSRLMGEIESACREIAIRWRAMTVRKSS